MADKLENYVRTHDEYQALRWDLEETGAGVIKAHRVSLGMSQTKYAEHLGISKAYVANIERGHMPLSVEVARKMIDGASR